MPDLKVKLYFKGKRRKQPINITIADWPIYSNFSS